MLQHVFFFFFMVADVSAGFYFLLDGFLPPGVPCHLLSSIHKNKQKSRSLGGMSIKHFWPVECRGFVWMYSFFKFFGIFLKHGNITNSELRNETVDKSQG